MNEAMTKKSNAVPRVGDSIYGIYNPPPKVTQVIWWPDKSFLKSHWLPQDTEVIIVLD